MTTTAVRAVTAAIVLFALASAFLAAPANAAPVFPADLEKATTAQASRQNATDSCQHSRFGCSIGNR